MALLVRDGLGTPRIALAIGNEYAVSCLTSQESVGVQYACGCYSSCLQHFMLCKPDRLLGLHLLLPLEEPICKRFQESYYLLLL